MAAEEARSGTKMSPPTYGKPLMEVPPFKYLGRVIIESDNDWPEVVANLRNAQKKWACLLRVMGWEGADAHTPQQAGPLILRIPEVCNDLWPVIV